MKCSICRSTEDVKHSPDVSQFVDMRVFLCDSCRREHTREEHRAEERAEELREEILHRWFHKRRRILGGPR